MLISPLVMLTDSQVQARNGVVSQAADPVDDIGGIRKEVCTVWLPVDEQAPFSDLDIEPVDGDPEF